MKYFYNEIIISIQVKTEGKSEKQDINRKNGDIASYKNKYHKEDADPAALERHQWPTPLRSTLTGITHSPSLYRGQLSAVTEVLSLKQRCWPFPREIQSTEKDRW